MFIFYVYAAVLIGILIIVHELGHFVAARASGVVVERFSIGFGKKLLSIRRGQTEYVISMIPLGGYVKMAGTDVSEHPVDDEPGPGTFPGKPVGIRALIVAAGPIANLVWAFLVYVGILWIGGAPMFGDDPVVGFVEAGSPAEAAGVEVLDRVLTVEGEPVETWADLRGGIHGAETGDGVELEVERPGVDGTVTLNIDAVPDSLTGEVTIGVAAYIPPLIGNVMRGSPADLAGMREGDRVTFVDSLPVRTWYELSTIVSERANEELTVTWERGGQTFSADIVAEETQEAVDPTEIVTVGTIGSTVPLMMRDVGFVEAVSSAAAATVSTTYQVLRTFWLILTQRISMDMVGGPIRVVQMASESARWGLASFFGFMAYLSLNLAILNLLPLPILDGGHLLLLGLERVRRRSPSERALLIWQQIGLIFFVGLAVFLLLRDVLLLR